MQTCYLFFALAVAAVSSEVININTIFDLGLSHINDVFRANNYTAARVPEGTFGNVSFRDSEILGLDSLMRTDNCTLEIVDENVTLDFHFGYRLCQQSFASLTIKGQEMSGGFRIRDNSAHLNFTVQSSGDRDCGVILHDLSLERLAKVDFYSSRPEYDGIDVEDYFQNVITPFLNNKIDKDVVKEVMELFICKQQHLEVSDNISLIYSTILEQLGITSRL